MGLSKLTESDKEEIRKNPDKVDWNFISFHYDLSESFIREFKDKVDWFWICLQQKLSESFIREFQDKVNWHCISVNKKIIFSDSFLVEFWDQLDIEEIEKKQEITKQVRVLVRLAKN